MESNSSYYGWYLRCSVAGTGPQSPLTLALVAWKSRVDEWLEHARGTLVMHGELSEETYEMNFQQLESDEARLYTEQDTILNSLMPFMDDSLMHDSDGGGSSD